MLTRRHPQAAAGEYSRPRDLLELGMEDETLLSMPPSVGFAHVTYGLIASLNSSSLQKKKKEKKPIHM
jgi:hypothetical protein